MLKTLQRWLIAIFFFVLSLQPLQGAAQEGDKDRVALNRPTIGLVLGGGGARGLAHVGIIAKLEAAGVRPDIIVGTSMGAVIGSLYAAGYSADELTEIAEDLDWQSLFRDAAPRDQLAFRRKDEERTFSTGLKLGVGKSGLNVPRGIIKGRRLKDKIAELLSLRTLATDFDALPIAFRAVATDIESFEAVVLESGDLPSAVFASMAVPAILPPQKIGSLTLIDGGLAANVPVRIARSLGADILIVVDLSVSPRKAEDINNVLGVLGQIATYLTLSNASKDVAAIKEGDLLITPDLGEYGSLDFNEAKSLIALGHDAMVGKGAALRRLALIANSEATNETRQERPIAPRINAIRINNKTSFPDSFIAEAIRQQPGKPLDYDKLTADINKIYGIDTFGTISFQVEDQADGSADMVVNLEPTDRGDLYLRFGLDLTTDFQSDTATNVSLGIIRRNVTQRGGEVRGLIQIGNNPTFAAEFFQPTDARQRWFGSVAASLERDPIRLFIAEMKAAGEINLDQARIEIAAGRVVARQVELRVGARQRWTRASQRIGLIDAQLPADESLQSVFGQVSLDSLDDAFFPTTGALGVAAYNANLSGGSTRTLAPSTVTGRLTAAIPFASGVLLPSTEFGFSVNGTPISVQTLQGDISVSGSQTLGGPARLSGLPPDSLFGRHKLFGSLTYYQPIREAEGLTRQPIYAGVTLEAGDVFTKMDDITLSNLRYGGSVFVGGRTPIGPLILGVGVTGNEVATFVSIGPNF